MKQAVLFFLAFTCIMKASANHANEFKGQADTLQPGSGIAFENRVNIPDAPKCNASEMYLKKKVKALVAAQYKDYTYIAVDITSFKGQKGYDDPKNTGQINYPFKIEMFVYLKRMVLKDGKEYTEYTTYEHDSVYEYVTQGRKKCDFYALATSDIKLISKELF